MAAGNYSSKVAVTFNKKQFEWLNAFADARGCSFAEAVRVMVNAQIKRMGDDGWRVSKVAK